MVVSACLAAAGAAYLIFKSVKRLMRVLKGLWRVCRSIEKPMAGTAAHGPSNKKTSIGAAPFTLDAVCDSRKFQVRKPLRPPDSPEAEKTRRCAADPDHLVGGFRASRDAMILELPGASRSFPPRAESSRITKRQACFSRVRRQRLPPRRRRAGWPGAPAYGP